MAVSDGFATDGDPETFTRAAASELEDSSGKPPVRANSAITQRARTSWRSRGAAQCLWFGRAAGGDMESHSLASGNREDPRRGESWQDAERSGAGFPKTRLWPYAVWVAVSDQESRPAIPAPRCPPALGRSLFFLPSRVISGLGVLSREVKGGGRRLLSSVAPTTAAATNGLMDRGAARAPVSLLLEMQPPLERDPEAAECGWTCRGESPLPAGDPRETREIPSPNSEDGSFRHGAWHGAESQYLSVN